MKVWIVMSYDWDWQEPVAVFDTKEAAVAEAKKLQRPGGVGYGAVEMELQRAQGE